MTSPTETARQVTSQTTSTNAKHVIQTGSYRSSQSPPACSSCRIAFDDEQEQRKHMKGPWHIYNLKRRTASLPPLPYDIFSTQIQPTFEHGGDSSTPRTAADSAVYRQCLFCDQTSGRDDQGLEDHIEHMSVVHGFFVPDITLLLDLESFLDYLAIVIREWHECFWCGTVRDCTTALQSHMRDKGHCKLNMEREPELLEFWEKTSEGVSTVPMKASSGALTPSSQRSGVSRVPQQRHVNAAESRGTTAVSRVDTIPRDPPRRAPGRQSCQELARSRDEMGIENIGPQQRRALVLALKRSQKEESIASRASEWSHAKKANKQKHDQAHGPLSWAKGGMHNLLPR